MNEMFPRIDEILTPAVRRRLNKEIIDQITTRYAEHGPEYISDKKLPDGRVVNQCMLKDSAQDAIEEVIDALFNTIILSMKQKYVGNILRHLVEAYNSLAMLKETHANPTR